MCSDPSVCGRSEEALGGESARWSGDTMETRTHLPVHEKLEIRECDSDMEARLHAYVLCAPRIELEDAVDCARSPHWRAVVVR